MADTNNWVGSGGMTDMNSSVENAGDNCGSHSSRNNRGSNSHGVDTSAGSKRSDHTLIEVSRDGEMTTEDSYTYGNSNDIHSRNGSNINSFSVGSGGGKRLNKKYRLRAEKRAELERACTDPAIHDDALLTACSGILVDIDHAEDHSREMRNADCELSNLCTK